MYIRGVRIVTISRENGFEGYSDVDIVDEGEINGGNGDDATDDDIL